VVWHTHSRRQAGDALCVMCVRMIPCVSAGIWAACLSTPRHEHTRARTYTYIHTYIHNTHIYANSPAQCSITGSRVTGAHTHTHTHTQHTHTYSRTHTHTHMHAYSCSTVLMRWRPRGRNSSIQENKEVEGMGVSPCLLDSSQLAAAAAVSGEH